MRFSRDRRGYENTFVLHGERRRGKGRARLLYWFRTPPDVKVGRAALDEDAIRLIEELNPDIEFDWTRILKGEAHTEPSADRPREGRRPDEGRTRDRARGPRQVQPQPAESAPPAAIPAAAETTSLPASDTGPAGEAPPPTPAHARLGREGVERLRGRYAEILTRITARLTDEAKREELKSLAERLNPDNWVTDDEVRLGLDEYEGVLASLRAAVGDRKRRRRRRGRSGAHASRSDTPPGTAGEPAADAVSGAGPDADADARAKVELSETDGDAEDF